MKTILCENIHKEASKIFIENKFDVKTTKSAFSILDSSLDLNILGIRSASKITLEMLKEFKQLKAIGAFCIGTDMVDLSSAAKLGIPVFNSPHSSTRSVAELVIAQVINMSRRLFDNCLSMKQNKWEKSSISRFEIRGKTIGIIGYGNIGSTVGILAEHLGMNVIFYDVEKKLAYGNAKQVANLESCLDAADFVTLHVPLTPQTCNLIDSKQIKMMRPGSYLINTSRGNVVNVDAVLDGLSSNHLAGFCADVFPYEPNSNGNWINIDVTDPNAPNGVNPFEKSKSYDSSHCTFKLLELTTKPNVILTSHIGGATEEAQKAIAEDVTTKLINFINTGSTIGAVNVPQLQLLAHKGKVGKTSDKIFGQQISEKDLIKDKMLSKDIKSGAEEHVQDSEGRHAAPEGISPKQTLVSTFRVMNFHHNVPGVLRDLNKCLDSYNIIQQALGTLDQIGYCIIDIESTDESISIKRIDDLIVGLPHTIKNRIINLNV